MRYDPSCITRHVSSGGTGGSRRVVDILQIYPRDARPRPDYWFGMTDDWYALHSLGFESPLNLER